jgi:hypothetical protein
VLNHGGIARHEYGVYHVFAELDAYEVQLRTDHLAVRLK